MAKLTADKVCRRVERRREDAYHEPNEHFWSKGMSGRQRTKCAKINKKQFAMGIKVEMEHTDDEVMAGKIAADHLTEFKDYYSYLDCMEKAMSAKTDEGRAKVICERGMGGKLRVEKGKMSCVIKRGRRK
jgi:hypothetical protein